MVTLIATAARLSLTSATASPEGGLVVRPSAYSASEPTDCVSLALAAKGPTRIGRIDREADTADARLERAPPLTQTFRKLELGMPLLTRLPTTVIDPSRKG